MKRFLDKTILITGGTSGIGAAAAEMFAEEGGNVVIVGRNEQKGKAQEKKIKQVSAQSLYISCDMTNKKDVEKLEKSIQRKFGKLDILVNSVGVLKTAGLQEIDEGNWEAVFEINVNSTVYCCQIFMPMLIRSRGVILNIASNVGLQSIAYGSRNYAYASSKAALIKFTQLLARNFGPEVRINCLCPGPTATDMWENKNFERFRSANLLDKVIQPEEVAKIILFLVSEDAAIMTGSIIVADAGANLKA